MCVFYEAVVSTRLCSLNIPSQQNKCVLMYYSNLSFAELNLSLGMDANQRESVLYVQLQNVTTCSNNQSDVQFILNTSLNSSIVFKTNGQHKTMGDLSVLSVHCSDNNILVYRVSVPSNEKFTVTGEITNAPLSPVCILVHAPGK